jgi:hypothetical protein
MYTTCNATQREGGDEHNFRSCEILRVSDTQLILALFFSLCFSFFFVCPRTVVCIFMHAPNFDHRYSAEAYGGQLDPLADDYDRDRDGTYGTAVDAMGGDVDEDL